MSRAVILIRTHDRNPAAKQRFRATAARLRAAMPDLPVMAAYITPGAAGAAGAAGEGANDLPLGQAVAQSVERGATEIALVPYEVEWAYPEAYDVPDALHDLAAEYPGVQLRLARPLGVGADLDPIVADHLEEAWSLPAAGQATVRDVAAIAGQTPITTAGLKPGDVPHLPAHAQHVFLCVGRRCMEQGSPDAYRALNVLVAESGLDSGPNRVKVTRTKCLSPCQAAPVACLYPSGDFYYHLDAATMPEFVERVLVSGDALPGRTFRAGE